MSKQLTPLGAGFCPLETAYGHGGPTEYCKNELHPGRAWCGEHLIEWGYMR
jgi:hypothetical protein